MSNHVRRLNARSQQRKTFFETLESRQMMSATPAPEYQGVVRSGNEWIFSASATGTGITESRNFGLPGDQFLAGDWNGDRLQDTVAVRANAEGGLTWYVDLGGDNTTDLEHKFGLAGDVAVLGDWDANGTDDPGVARRNQGANTFQWFLDPTHATYANPNPRSYGLISRGDRPIVGDWNGDGKDDLGVTYEDRTTGYLTWLLDTNGDAFQDITRRFGLTDKGDVPLAGDWNGDRKDDVAVARPETLYGEWGWYFDTNGDTVADKTSRFGKLTDIPVPVESSITPSGRDRDDRLVEATDLGALGNSRTISDSVADKTDVDLFKFTVTAGTTVTFDIDTPTNGPPGLGSYLRIFNSSGGELAANNDRLAPGEQPGPNSGTDGFDSYIPLTFSTAGTYYVGVSNWQHRSYDPVSGRDALMSDPNWLTGWYQLVISTANATQKPTASFANGILTVKGTPNADRVDVLDYGGRISVEASMNGMTVTLPIKTVTTTVNDLASSTVVRIEMNGGAGNDVLGNVSYKPSIIRGGAGEDILFGGDDVDQLYGDDDKDTLYGGFGNDLIWGGTGNDSLYGGVGDDVILGEVGNDLLSGMQGNDRLYGGSENDQLFGGEGLDGLFGGVGYNQLQGESGADRFLYRSGFDSIVDYYSEDAAILFVNADANWSDNEIMNVDAGLHLAHMRTKNTTLLKLADGGQLYFGRTVYYAPQGGTGTVLARNFGDGRIGFTTAAFQGLSPITNTVLHELGHNWDEENPYWTSFYPISWSFTLTGWKSFGTEFVSTYSQTSRNEDFAESFAATLLENTGKIPNKARVINTWLSTL
jgi:Ca2+-binding RTX toxin-like protein